MERGNIRRALALVRRRTHRAEPLHITLMEKPDCELCAEAHRALRRIGLDRPLEVERIDITSAGGDVHNRYVLRIPVLLVGSAELDAAGLEDQAIIRWLREVAPA